MKLAIAFFLLAASALAQNKTSATPGISACGPLSAHFDAKVSTAPPSTPQVEPDKALVYFIEDFRKAANNIGEPTVRLGLDGNWMGATKGPSYFFFLGRSRGTPHVYQLAVQIAASLEPDLLRPA